MPDVPRDKAGDRARDITEGGSEGHAQLEDDPEGAKRAAEAILEESEARIADPATRDPDEEGVIRRDSEETASTGE